MELILSWLILSVAVWLIGWALGGALMMSVLGTIGEWLVRAVF